jgi:hypothetical protein
MGNYEELKAAVASVIKANGNQEITGQVLQNTLTTLISQIGVNATFAGIATPSTAPGTPDQNVFYIAGQSGTYPNFNAIVLDNEIAILSNKSGTWVKTTTGFATNDGIGNVIGLDNVNDRPVYVNAIKFIGFVPNEASKDHIFSIHGFSSRGNTKSATPNITELDLFILDETASQAAGAERRAASLVLPANTDITKPTFSKITGNSGTLYVIIDWNPVVNYQVNGQYSYIVWGANFANPSASNLVRIQKLDANDPRIVNWDNAIKTGQLVGTYGGSETNIINQLKTSAIIGMPCGLAFNFPSRYDLEVKAMQIIKRAYFSFKDGVTPVDVGIGVLGTGGGDGTKFWFGFGRLDGTGSGFGTIPMLAIDTLPNGVVPYFVETSTTRYYVEIDFDKWREIGNVIWSWSTPCCKMTNIIPNDSSIWDEVLAQNIQKQNNTAFAFTEAFAPQDLQQGYYQVSGQKVVISTNIPDKYRSIKIDLFANNISRMRVSLDPYGVIVYAAIYTDSNDNYISRELKGNDKTEIYMNYELTIPSNARYVYISGYAAKIAELNPGVMAYKYVYNAKSNYQITGYPNNGLDWRNVSYPNPVVDIVNKAIKFIAFVPNATYKNDMFTINALSCYGNTGSETFTPTSFDLWLFDMIDGNQSTVKYTKTDISSFNYDYPEVIKSIGARGTLYAIVDWNVVRGYFNKNVNKWYPIFWSSSFNDKPIVQKLDANDPRIAGFNQIAPVSPTQFADFTKLNLGVDGDSITADNQWSYYATQYLGLANHHNVAVGSATFSDRTQTYEGVTYVTQNYDDPDFAGISSGWQPTTDPVEIQKRCNNCARVHVQKFISEVTAGTYPVPDIFVFAMGTNDSTIGTVADALNGKDPDALSAAVRQTMVGGARWAIQKIITTYPNCRVYISAPIQIADAMANAKGLEKSIALKEISNSLSVGYFNTFGECGITEKVESGTAPYLSDGLHPNAAGQQLMGKYLAKEIRNNYF